MTGSCRMNGLRGACEAKNGDLKLGKFEPHHFRTLYTHINQIMHKKAIRAKDNRTGLHLDPPVSIHLTSQKPLRIKVTPDLHLT